MPSINGRERADRGYSLLETMVVLAILGVLTVGIAVRLQATIVSTETAGQARELARALTGAQRAAIADNQETALVLDLNSGAYRATGGGNGSVTADQIVATAAAEVSDAEARRAAFRFFPDGSSTGGSIRLAGDGGAYRIDIDWLTGRVWVERDDQD